MYEVFLKSWYQERPEIIQEECMGGEHKTIEDAFEFLKMNADEYIDYYPIVEMGVRLIKN